MTIFVCTGNAGKLAEFSSYLGASLGTAMLGIKDLEANSGQAYREPPEDFDTFLGNAASKLVGALCYVARTPGLVAATGLGEILVDDSGLCVPAMGFAPGVHSASLAGPPRSDERNRAALRARIVETLGGTGDGEARLDAFFVCFLLRCPLTPALLSFFSQSCAVSVRPSRLVQTVETALFTDAARGTAARSAGGGHQTAVALSEFLPEYPGTDEVRVYFGHCAGQVSTVEQNLVPGAGHGYDAMFYPIETPLESFASVPLETKNKQSHRAHALHALAKDIKNPP